MVSKKTGALRARKEEDKSERRQRLLEAARALLAAHPYADIKMQDVAHDAGFAKGTLFFYFETKEALFLQLLESELFSWLDALDKALGEGGRYTEERVARAIASTLAAQPLLTPLLSLLGTVLEQNIAVERIVAFKTALLARLAVTGAKLERRLPDLPEGHGPQTLLRVYALVIGLYQLTDPSPNVKKALERPELSALVLDFETELTPLLTALFRGLSLPR